MTVLPTATDPAPELLFRNAGPHIPKLGISIGIVAVAAAGENLSAIARSALHHVGAHGGWAGVPEATPVER